MSRSFRKAPCISDRPHTAKRLRKWVKAAIQHGDDILPVDHQVQRDMGNVTSLYGWPAAEIDRYQAKLLRK